jgi:hypothetical protein
MCEVETRENSWSVCECEPVVAEVTHEETAVELVNERTRRSALETELARVQRAGQFYATHRDELEARLAMVRVLVESLIDGEDLCEPSEHGEVAELCDLLGIEFDDEMEEN